MRGVNQTGLPTAGVHSGHNRAHLAVGAADGHVCRVGRVGQRSQNVEDARNAERGTNRAHEAHGRVEGARERESDAHFIADFADRFRLQVQRQAEVFEHVGCTALRGGGAVAVLDNLHAGCGSSHRTHGGQVHGGEAVTTGAHDVSGLTGNVQRHGVRDHGLGGATHLVGGQSQLLLHGERRTHGGRVRVALHQVVHKPLRFLSSKVVSPDQLGENRLPCDLGHDALLGVSLRRVMYVRRLL